MSSNVNVCGTVSCVWNFIESMPNCTANRLKWPMHCGTLMIITTRWQIGHLLFLRTLHIEKLLSSRKAQKKISRLISVTWICTSESLNNYHDVVWKRFFFPQIEQCQKKAEIEQNGVKKKMRIDILKEKNKIHSFSPFLFSYEDDNLKVYLRCSCIHWVFFSP